MGLFDKLKKLISKKEEIQEKEEQETVQGLNIQKFRKNILKN